MNKASVETKSAKTIKHRLSTLHAALITPYDTEDKVSVSCLHRLVKHVKRQGIDGFYVGGSTGEGLLQSSDERRAIFSEVAEAADGSALIGHVGAISTREAQALAKQCAALGYDAVSAIAPIYFPHRKDAVIGYYKDIIDVVPGTPLIVYNIPAMSGVSFTLEDLGRLLELPNVIGIKQTSIDMYQMEQLKRFFPDALLLNGYDEVLLAGLVSGAHGGVGSTYNVMGDRYLDLIAKMKKGDVRGAADIQSGCNAVIDELIRAGVFPGLKYMLYRQGVIETPNCRKPLVTLSSASAGRLDEIAHRITRFIGSHS